MQRLKVSDNQHYLVTDDDQPFFWLGDTAWEMLHRCNLQTEIPLYLDNRKAKGFNVIQTVILAEQYGLQQPSPAGHLPLHDMDPAKPNEDYFADVENVINMAVERGLYLCLLPTWGDKVNLAWGAGPVIFNEANARIYGQYLGKRFRDYDNLIWMIGGDRREVEGGVDYRPIWRAMAEGIKSEASQLMTYHPMGGRGSSMEFHQDDWLQLNTWQSGHGHLNEPIWEQIHGDWMRQPTKPVLDSEPCYEDIHIQFIAENGAFTPYDVRRRVYRGVFAGGCGVTYGQTSVWQMYSAEHDPVLEAEKYWKDSLDTPGAFQMQHLKNLMLSRPYLSRIPDQSILKSAEGTFGNHVRATRDAHGRYAMIYIPTTPITVDVDLQRLEGETFTASWFNPRNGETTKIGSYKRRDQATFTPDWRGPDWVLIIDSDS
ncbi:MAG: glycoside hydrolase family 140 protein [Aggregatilineales bacterium]